MSGYIMAASLSFTLGVITRILLDSSSEENLLKEQTYTVYRPVYTMDEWRKIQKELEDMDPFDLRSVKNKTTCDAGVLKTIMQCAENCKRSFPFRADPPSEENLLKEQTYTVYRPVYTMDEWRKIQKELEDMDMFDLRDNLTNKTFDAGVLRDIMHCAEKCKRRFPYSASYHTPIDDIRGESQND